VIPASDRILAQIDTTQKKFVSCSLKKDAALIRDRIYVEGGHPMIAGTWGFRVSTASPDPNDTGLQKGWTSTEETEWDTADIKVRNGKLAHVWRRYVLGPKFYGSTARTIDQLIWFERAKGTTGETGKYLAGDRLPKVEDIRFARYLPWPRNDQPLANVDQFGGASKTGTGFAEPRAYLYDYIADKVHVDLTEDYTVTVEENAAAVLIGNPDQGQEIKDLISDGYYMLAFTLALVHPLVWRVSWERPDADMARNWRRNVFLKYPELNYWACLDGTIVQQSALGAIQGPDIDTGGSYYTDTMPLAFHVGFGGDNQADPNVPRLQNLLQLARGLYETGNTGFSWSVRGIEVPSTDGYMLGDYIPSAKIQIDDRRAIEQDIGAVISGISWDFAADGMMTHYTCERMIPGIDRIAIGAVGPGLHGGQDAAIIANEGAYQ
jgi:hypothetical protein